MMAQVIPIRSVRPIADAELSRLVGDTDAAFRRDNIVDFERHRISRVYRRMCAEVDRFDGPPRQYRIEPRIGFDWLGATAIASILVAVFCISFFAAAYVGAWGQM